MESYLGAQRDTIFRNVEVLIYVIDVEARDLDKDFQYFFIIIRSIIRPRNQRLVRLFL